MTSEEKIKTNKIDAVLTHRIFGLLIFLLLMYLVFDLTFRLGKYPMSGLEYLFSTLARFVGDFWPDGQTNLLKSLILDGIISGVGGVVIFLPNVLLLFAAIAILEDSGYMARAAIVAGRVMDKVGLHGKSFVPMLIGFGCTVPAIIACRTLEDKKSRLATILVLPLFSCGARITIYSLFIPAFFPLRWRGAMMLLIYLIGIVLAVIAAKILNLTILKKESSAFAVKLLPYKIPKFQTVLRNMWQMGWEYLKKAGTVILAVSVILWFAGNFPKSSPITAKIGRAIEPAFKPLGFDNKVAVAMIGATAAKEIFVVQMGVAYAISEHDDISVLRTKLNADYTPLQAFCIMLFCLISTPCIATIAATKTETGRWKWAIFQWTGLTAMAYVITLIVYQTGLLFLR
jgi:ferrous iron transport protein B